mgnify:CR=1 FL=1
MDYRDHLYDELLEFNANVRAGTAPTRRSLGICANLRAQISNRGELDPEDCYWAGVQQAMECLFEELGYDRSYTFGEDEFNDNPNLWEGECRERRVRLLEEMLEHLS